MPLPAIAGVGWLGSLLAGLFAHFLGFFARFFTKRIAIVAAVIALSLTLTTAFYASIEGLLAVLSPSLPPQFSQAMGMFIPSNAKGCVSAVMTAYALRWVYDWQIKVLTYKNAGSGF